jgi:sugar phosphate permease
MLTAMGIGALGSAILIASIGDQVPRGLFMLGGVFFYGVAVMALAASSWFPVSVALMVIVGAFHVSSHALVQTVIQTYAEAEFRGRTMAVFHQSHLILMIGGMTLGGLATAFGAQWAMAIMAAAGSVTMLVIFLIEPVARRIR